MPFNSVLTIYVVMNDNFQVLLNHISDIRGERDTQKRLERLMKLNNSLPENLALRMPSLITNAYVRHALDLMEDKISLAVSRRIILSLEAA